MTNEYNYIQKELGADISNVQCINGQGVEGGGVCV